MAFGDGCCRNHPRGVLFSFRDLKYFSSPLSLSKTLYISFKRSVLDFYLLKVLALMFIVLDNYFFVFIAGKSSFIGWFLFFMLSFLLLSLRSVIIGFCVASF